MLTQGCISASLGVCRAALGRSSRAGGRWEALESYAGADPAAAPPWAWFVTDAEIAAGQGYALYLPSLSRPEFAPAAVEQLASAVNGHGAAKASAIGLHLPPLAVAYFRAGDFDAAVAAGHQAA